MVLQAVFLTVPLALYQDLLLRVPLAIGATATSGLAIPRASPIFVRLAVVAAAGLAAIMVMRMSVASSSLKAPPDSGKAERVGN